MELQSLIARFLDDDNYALVYSLDLRWALDMVDVKLQIKRLKILGLPDDIIFLIKVWLDVLMPAKNSVLFSTLLGTLLWWIS
jgi:hypothetical protein